MTTPYGDERAIRLDEASRQLELAVHDAQVAFDCIALGHIDRAHTNALTARAAVDAAETMLRAALGGADLAVTPGVTALMRLTKPWTRSLTRRSRRSGPGLTSIRRRRGLRRALTGQRVR